MIHSQFQIIVNQALPNTIKSIAFNINGIFNPDSERKTAAFKVQSFDANKVLIETSGEGLFTLSAVRGQIQQVNITSDNMIVGQYSNLQISIKTQNNIPYNAQIQILFPKWNTDSLFQKISHFNVANDVTTSQRIQCVGIQNIRTVMNCAVIVGSSFDKLTITYAFEKIVPAGTIVIFNLTEFKNPPSTEAITLNQISTLDNLGNIVDQQTNIGSYSVTTAASILKSNFQIVPAISTINTLTSYDLAYKISMPVPSGSQIIITFPKELQIFSKTTSEVYLSQIYQYGKMEGFVNFRILQSNDGFQRVQIIDAIQSYLDQGSNINLKLNRVMNSGTSAPTSSFKLQLLRASQAIVEQLDNGITVQFNTRYSFNLVKIHKFNVNQVLEFRSLLKVHISSIATAIELKLVGFKIPPSEKQIDSFSFTIRDTQGYLIGFYTKINLIATFIASQLSFVNITTSIQETSSIANLNVKVSLISGQQVQLRSVFKLMLPNEIQVRIQSELSCQGVTSMNSNLDCSYNNITRIIQVQDRQQLSSTDGPVFIEFQIKEIITPVNTKATQTFKLNILTDDGFEQLYANSSLNIQMQKGTSLQSAKITPYSMKQIQAGQQIQFLIKNLQNPTSTRTSDSFQIKQMTYDLQYTIAEQQIGMSVQTATPNQITQANAFALNGKLGEQKIQYKGPASCNSISGLEAPKSLLCNYNQLDNSLVINSGLEQDQTQTQLIKLEIVTLNFNVTLALQHVVNVKALNHFVLSARTLHFFFMLKVDNALKNVQMGCFKIPQLNNALIVTILAKHAQIQPTAQVVNCERCSDNCLECESTVDQCKSCNQNSNYKILIGKKCASSCPSGYEINYSTYSCIQVAEQIVPFPFLGLSMLSILVIGAIKICCIKLNYKDTCIGICSIFLVLNWFYLYYLILKDEHCQDQTKIFRQFDLKIKRMLNNFSLVQIGCCFFPVLIQNFYNIFYTNYQRQVFFSDIESIAHITLMIIVIVIDVNSKRHKIRKIELEIKNEEEELQLKQQQNTVMYTGTTPRTDMGNSVFMRNNDFCDPDQGLLNSYDDIKKFEQIMKHFLHKKKQEMNVNLSSRHSTLSNQSNDPVDLISKKKSEAKIFPGIIEDKRDGDEEQYSNNYDNQSIHTTNRSFTNLMLGKRPDSANLQQIGQKNKVTLFSERLMTSSNYGAFTNFQNLESNSSLFIKDQSDLGETYRVPLTDIDPQKLVLDIYNSEQKEQRLGRDDGDFVSNLHEKMSKQKSLPKFLMRECNQKQSFNHTMNQLKQDKENIIFYSPDNQDEENQSPTFNELKQTQQMIIKSNKLETSSMKKQNYQSYKTNSKPKKTEQNGITNSENVKNISPNNYSFAQMSGSVKYNKKVNELYVANDIIHELNLKDEKMKLNSEQKQTSDQFDTKNHQSNIIMEFQPAELNIKAQTQKHPLLTLNNLQTLGDDQSDFKFDLQKVINEETYRDNIESLRIMKLVDSTQPPQKESLQQEKQPSTLCQEEVEQIKQKFMETDYIKTDEELIQRVNFNDTNRDEKLSSLNLQYEQIDWDFAYQDNPNRQQQEKQVFISPLKSEIKQCTHRHNFEDLDELSQTYSDNQDVILRNASFIERKQDDVEYQQEELKEQHQPLFNPIDKNVMSKTFYGQKFYPTKNQLFDSVDHSNFQSNNSHLNMPAANDNMRRTQQEFLDKRLINDLNQHDRNRNNLNQNKGIEDYGKPNISKYQRFSEQIKIKLQTVKT
eukprot:403338550